MYRCVKWILDRIIAFFALCVTAPFLLVIALLVSLDSPGGPFLLQKREGYKKKTITIIKFRTMYGKEEPFDIDRPVIDRADARVTRIGGFLRRTKLDELPQLINILKGDMSFVGPRPLLPVYYKRYDRWEFRKFSFRPGLTGLSQVRGNGYLTVAERSYYDVLYTEKCSFLLDIKILLMTIGVIVKGEKAFLREPDPEDRERLRLRYQSPKGRITIGEVIGDARIGGVKSVVINYLDHMDLTRYDMHLFTYGPSEADKLFSERGWTVHYLPNFKWFPSARKAFRRELKRRHYDIIHSHLTALSVFPLKEAKRAGVEVRICHAHSTASSRGWVSIVKNLLKGLAEKYATHLLACGERAASWMYGDCAKEVQIVRNAIDLDRFRYSECARVQIRERFSIPSSAFVVGAVGRLETQKNLGCLLAAFSQLTGSPYLLLVGEGRERDRLERQARKLGVRDRVIFVGMTEEVAPYYSAMDIFALPSLYEGLPVVGIEAQANGLPCLFSEEVTREVAIAEKVFFAKSTPEAFAAAIKTLPKGRMDAFEQLRAAGYDIRSEGEKLSAFYREAFRDAEEKLRCKVYKGRFGGGYVRFKAPPFLPWREFLAIAEMMGGPDRYIDGEGYLHYQEMEADFRKTHPESTQSISEEKDAEDSGK